ncbi:MAG: site-specific integrase [Prevotellaceae bacterium]|jgi:integrase|nr:site-specific integrase [Prevotellaceae bacterium]
MATVTAFIKSKKETTKVRFEVSQGRGKQKLYYTSEIEIKTKAWSKKEQGISSRYAYIATQERIGLNAAIFERKTTVLQSYLSLPQPTSELLTAEINRRLNKSHERTEQIQDLFNVFLSKKQYKIMRERQFRGLCKLMTEFETANRLKIDIRNISVEFVKDFFMFIDNGERGHNTKNGILKRMRTFFRWLLENEYIKNNPFEKFSIPPDLYGTPYYLTIEERNKIYECDFSNFPHLEIQRDIFIFHCCTGCRVSDLINFTKDNLIDGAIEYIPRKTIDEHVKTVRVPLNKVAMRILDKYKDYGSNKLLPFISDVKYNEALKKIFTIAGITRQITIINPRTRKTEQKPLNEIASSHIARRTFIGNIYKQVKDPNLVGALTGHAESSKAFARYRDIDEEMKKDLVRLIE